MSDENDFWQLVGEEIIHSLLKSMVVILVTRLATFSAIVTKLTTTHENHQLFGVLQLPQIKNYLVYNKCIYARCVLFVGILVILLLDHIGVFYE